MRYILNLAYLLVIAAASPVLLYRAIAHGKYRQGWSQKLFGFVPRRQAQGKCLWFHAVSVGEVNLLAPLLAEIGRRHPAWQCVISTTTATGFATARKKYPRQAVFYCPLDFSWAVETAMRRILPDCVVLAELELWPNLIAAARRSGARVAVINGRLSQRSFRGYRWLRWLLAPMLDRIDLFAVQNAEYAERFSRLGAKAESIRVTGSIKFDGAQTDRCNAASERLRHLAGIEEGDVVFLAGSTQHPEEEAALAAYAELAGQHPELRLIVVPRHPERFDSVAAMLDRQALAWQRRSRLEAEGARPSTRVLLVDTVGELGAWWAAASIAFVGGSLGNRGGQNMIEPAAYGAAVCFGPNTRNFRDIVELMLAQQAAVVVNDPAGLSAFVGRCLSDPAFAAGLGQRARALVARQLGATDRTLELLEPLLELTSFHASKAA